MNLAALKAAINHDDTMAAHYKRILEAVAEGKTEVEFYDLDKQVHNSNEHALTNAQADLLRDKGYTVNWEKYATYKWTVSGWA